MANTLCGCTKWLISLISDCVNCLSVCKIPETPFKCSENSRIAVTEGINLQNSGGSSSRSAHERDLLCFLLFPSTSCVWFDTLTAALTV